jgi:hypothetical protein
MADAKARAGVRQLLGGGFGGEIAHRAFPPFT